ncbi:MAG: pyruvate dehydrogenase (acetyl-transferring), homodimeric type [Betaproteobacteria bacterium]|nr:MAG: pyruvate dehydrogenase (acetyl-transferring), homodimeric type [Betaproteobacteria bacterium]
MGILNDPDPVETREWVDSLKAVVQYQDVERARYLLGKLRDEAALIGARPPFTATTPYRNTIPPDIILRANKESSELGGHIASFQSSALLYDIGFGHFWHGASDDHGGDLVYVQGHVSPGIYARAFVEGRLTEQQLQNFRQETEGKGIPSYPHPWLMPDFWQFPTVSMGLGPLMAIYQARFLKYLEGRGLAKTEGRKVWAFLGDGECDEPESLGAISLAGRERLDNLIFVINCNLQRLDGPVRGNGKIVQELEGIFRGAGWNVIKVLWGSAWDKLFAKDKNGLLLQRMEECVDGQYQDFKSKDGAYVREHFFNTPELKALVADLSDEEVWKLNRGGHDPFKVYAAYAAAVKHKDQPTVILAKTVKGYGMGEAGEGQMIAHQAKKMKLDALQQFRDRFQIPIADKEFEEMAYIRFADDSPEMKYLKERRAALGGYLPQRRRKSTALAAPPLSNFERLLQSSGEREISTTMAFVQMLGTLVRDKTIGKHIVPIVPDESRTFGMEGMFRQLGIYSAVGQLYKPQDADQLMYYREDKSGQVLQEGINEAGAMSSWIAAATSYGFLLGGTAGRTTLNGEGLQHEDGHSHILASTIPNCVSYDPSFAYEVVVIVRDGIRRMFEQQEDVYYYITLMNENYPQPAMPADAEERIVRGMYLFQDGGKGKGPRVQLMGSGTILREVIAAAELLKSDFNVNTDVWSVTSFNELRRDGMSAERFNLLHPTKAHRKSYVESSLDGHSGPVVAATDYMRNFADQIRGHIPRRFVTLGTDGFGRSDYRVKLRRFFEVNRHYVAVAALKALADDGELKAEVADQAIRKYALDSERPDPWTV